MEKEEKALGPNQTEKEKERKIMLTDFSDGSLLWAVSLGLSVGSSSSRVAGEELRQGRDVLRCLSEEEWESVFLGEITERKYGRKRDKRRR